MTDFLRAVARIWPPDDRTRSPNIDIELISCCARIIQLTLYIILNVIKFMPNLRFQLIATSINVSNLQTEYNGFIKGAAFRLFRSVLVYMMKYKTFI